MPIAIFRASFLFALTFFCLCLLIGRPAFSATGDGSIRLALVIGNSDYESAPLKNPANDAQLMARTLREMNFKVWDYQNLSQKKLKRAMRDFARELQEAGEDAVSLIYYAGHGIQVDGVNYLVPVDADIRHELDVDIEAVSAQSMLQTLKYSNSRLNIVILDACRNNPYKRSFRSAPSGLAKMDAPRGTLLAYSTAPGQTASDGNGKYSPYTQALVRSMKSPGRAVEQVFKSVRVSVMDRTNDVQVPWESSSLTGEFFFTPEPEPVAAPEPAPAAPVAPAAPAGPDPAVQAEFLFWQTVQSANNVPLYEAYLAQYPDGQFTAIARVQIDVLKKQEAEAARLAEQQKALQQQAQLQRSVTQDKEAALLEEKVFFEAIQTSDKATDFQTYLDRWPNGVFSGIARRRIAEIENAEKAAASAPKVAALPPTRAGPLQGKVRWKITMEGRGGPGQQYMQLCRAGRTNEDTFETVDGRGFFKVKLGRSGRQERKADIKFDGPSFYAYAIYVEFVGRFDGNKVTGKFRGKRADCGGTFEMVMLNRGS